MRVREFVRFALGGLWRQKVRSILTIAGVAVGAASLAFSLSLGVGLRAMIDREFRTRPGFWEIQVMPEQRRTETDVPATALEVPPGINPERADRLRQVKRDRYLQEHGPTVTVPLTPERLAQIGALPGVKAVQTYRHHFGRAELGTRSAPGLIIAGPAESTLLRNMLLVGRLANPGAAEVVVSENFLIDLGFTTEAEFDTALDQPLTLIFGEPSAFQQQSLLGMLGSNEKTGSRVQLILLRKLLAELPQLIPHSSLTELDRAELLKLFPQKPITEDKSEILKTTLTIVGIARAPADEKERGRGMWLYQNLQLYATSETLEPTFRTMHKLADGRHDSAEVLVTPGADLDTIVKQIEAMGFNTTSAVEWFGAAKREVTAIALGLNAFAWIALIVAALGITNTLVTNVVERTREIGILKAIGASRRQVLSLFLFEGTLIGLVGGTLGLVAARLIAGPADAFVQAEVQRQARGQMLVSDAIFAFPLWLSAGTILVAALTTTLAALYPARRAATIAPVEALKVA